MIIVELYEREARLRGRDDHVLALAGVPGLTKNGNSFVGYPDAVEAFAQRISATKTAILVDRRSAYLPFAYKNRLLRDYQAAGVTFLMHHAPSGAFLADDVGLGKTAQTLFTIKYLGAKKILVVCPAIAKHVWEREAAKWLGMPSVVIQGKGNAVTLQKNALNIFNYEILHSYTPQETDLIILDEAHYLSNERSRRSQAAKAWAEKASAKIALSATPMTTRVRDLWNVVDTISPNRFGKFFPFARLYAGAHQATVNRQGTTVWIFDWPKSMTDRQREERALYLQELNLRLPFFMLRRTKAEVMSELPERARQIIEIDVPDTSLLTSALETEDRRIWRKALDLAGAGKVPEIALWAKDIVGANHQLILVTHLRSTAARLAKLLRCPYITGEMQPDDRVALVSSKPDVLVATIDSMTVGIDLSYADTLAFVDLDYVPSKLLQMEGRLHRMGQKRNVGIYYFVAKRTVDERVRAVVLERLEMYEAVLGDVEAVKLKNELRTLPRSEDELLAAMRTAILEAA